MIDGERITPLNSRAPVKGGYVLYWMQQAQRFDFNHALQYAVQEADRHDLGVVVAFCLVDDYPGANLRHYAFMMEGLRETVPRFREAGMQCLIVRGRPEDVIPLLSRDACLVVVDRGYLRHQVLWRTRVAARIECPLVQVESDIVVPVETASPKAEYAARTIRLKIHRHRERFLRPLETRVPRRSSLGCVPAGIEELPGERSPEALNVDRTAAPVGAFFTGGPTRGRVLFQAFLRDKLGSYVQHHNQPQTDDCSCMSMYLHFGQVSPLDLALQALELDDDLPEDVDAFLEELIVRRELAINFVRYTGEYDSFSCLPAWARKTLERHGADRRPQVYSTEELDGASTHDTYWNAAMTEMKVTGFMHNYMRMYWGKKILEWRRTPQEAWATLLELNNRYFLDGRDPSSYAGAGWVFGLHDRPWGERGIYGTVRTMTASGLERKCDIRAYVEKVNGSVGRAGLR